MPMSYPSSLEKFEALDFHQSSESVSKSSTSPFDNGQSPMEIKILALLVESTRVGVEVALFQIECGRSELLMCVVQLSYL